MDEHNISFEPMDIDQSIHSNTDVSLNESTSGIDAFIRKVNDSVKSPTPSRDEATETPLPVPGDNMPYPTNIKKFHINIQKKAVANTYSTTKMKVICAALVLFFSALAYQVFNIHCSHDIRPVELRQSLLRKLHGQTTAIDALIEGLTSKERSRVLILYGSTGVGKSFAGSILLEHVGPSSNIYHYTMPSFMDTFSSDFMVGLTVCKNTIIIIDDLSPNDKDVKVHIDKLIKKSESLEKVVTVLLIYNNCNHATNFIQQCNEYFPIQIMDHLKDIKGYKTIIKFGSLTETHLRMCIETELERKVTDDQFKKILKNFNVNTDGCKGVHAKMKLMDLS